MLVLSFPCAAAVRWGAVDVFRARAEEASLAEDAGTVVDPAEAVLVHPEPWRLPSAAVLGVVDGDTLAVFLDGVQEKVRFAGVDAPEVDEPCGPAATERTRVLSGGRVLLGPTEDGRARDVFGRLLRHPYDPAGRSLEAALVREGAVRARRDGSTASAVFTGLELEARRDRTGCLWGDP